MHLAAGDVDDAREQLVLAAERGRTDNGLAAGTAAARDSMRGFTTGNVPKLTPAIGLSR